MITTSAEYAGQPSIRIAATQLVGWTRTAATRVLDEWVEFFTAGDSPIQELHFVSRTPKRLFDALATQSQLKRLELKWGDYENLKVLAEMSCLEELVLNGASSVQDLGPLAALQSVKRLEISSLKRVSDLSPIGQMRGVTSLDLGGDWMSIRIAHVESIGFLDQMPQLKELLLHTMIVDDLDYTPLQRLPSLESIRVMKARGMTPSFEELKATLPWSE